MEGHASCQVWKCLARLLRLVWMRDVVGCRCCCCFGKGRRACAARLCIPFVDSDLKIFNATLVIDLCFSFLPADLIRNPFPTPWSSSSATAFFTIVRHHPAQRLLNGTRDVASQTHRHRSTAAGDGTAYLVNRVASQPAIIASLHFHPFLESAALDPSHNSVLGTRLGSSTDSTIEAPRTKTCRLRTTRPRPRPRPRPRLRDQLAAWLLL